MRNIAILSVLLFVFFSLTMVSMVAAQYGTDDDDAITLKGVIIDNMCAGSQQPDALPNFVKNHTKACVLKCVDSGYSLYTDGKLMKFDKDSNDKIAEFLKQDDNTLNVVVEVKMNGDMLSLVSIKNQ